MQRDTAFSETTGSFVDQVLERIQLLRQAYSPVMLGEAAFGHVQHVLDVLSSQVSALDRRSGYLPATRLSLITGDQSAHASVSAAERDEAHTPLHADSGRAVVLLVSQEIAEPAHGSASSAPTGQMQVQREPRVRDQLPPTAPPDLGNEPRDDVGRAFRSALLADLARRSTRPASTPPAPRTGPHETAPWPVHEASASTSAPRPAMPTS